ncbi:uncharacterized protein LOC128964764 [Oppia nitens]|uniref:uncharacterized protein LOC128964764 n=1 Tax=Oppia nitens TaxID=1686743 RepID=UPI0023DB4E73|nr:uncharacterized protein LOC128964764 [Oppia nitens]
MDSNSCSYVATQRGGVALLFEGHRYNKVRDGKDGTVYWRCSRDRQCPGRAVTVNNRVKKANNKHNHPPEAALRNGTAGSSLISSPHVPSISASTSKDRNDEGLLASSIALQDVIEAQAAAAAAFPSIVTETLKYLAVASGNPQMAAAFASSMASLSNPSLKNFNYSLGSRNIPLNFGGLRPLSYFI